MSRMRVYTNEEFKKLLLEKGDELYRLMPWREDTRPYYVLVSELMLQQTQVVRVMPKFETFIARFPDVSTLADAGLDEVLRFWQGLGYNRRAKFLHEAAKMTRDDFFGIFPSTETELLKLPGVGKNTAGAILAYAFNQPALFIETNVRTVYLHHFFAEQTGISDRQILEKLVETIDRDEPRRFYQSIMDYGTYLKSNGVKNISASKHYRKQAPLRGSIREVRGLIIKMLGEKPYLLGDLRSGIDDERFTAALDGLLSDGLIQKNDTQIHLTK